jgi:hypothetical protein
MKSVLFGGITIASTLMIQSHPPYRKVFTVRAIRV